MKTLFLLIFAVLVSTNLMFSQSNTSAVTQTGDDHKADVTQIGATNDATVSQTAGNGNRIGAPTASDPGINVGSEVDDISKAKGLVQEGNQNTANLTQTGNTNVIQQFRELRGVFNSVYQKGDDNSITIEQIGDNHVVGQAVYEYDGLDQVGNGNTAGIYQNGGVSNKLHVFYQKGDDNTANIQQIGSNNLISSATQALLGVGSANNQLYIVQDGQNNRIDNAGELGTNILGDINQIGDNNRAGMQLTHDNAFGDIDQLGNYNRATLTINMSYIGDNNAGTIFQDGDHNEATQMIGQTDPSEHSSNNTMSTSQTGDYNEADTWVQGSYNNATVTQAGDHHVSDITQTGDTNQATVTQNN